ncbi:MAG TPA: hypothetical protein VE621_01325, partial [Bryobacteraceae bacterium]|nr:hypothetical protein [Bryobacteraceae bacterium]
QRTLRLPVPGRDAGLLVKLLQYDLNAYPPGAPILGVAVEVEPVEPRRLQNGLFIPQGPEPERLEVTIARIAAVVGEDNIGSPEMLNTHRPGAFRMNRFVMGEEWTAREVKPRLALRYYRPPLEAKVQTRGGRPVSLAAPGIRARVVAYGGPWRSSGDWWTTTSWDRDEWDVACEGGLLYRIFSEGGKWFVEGNYD